MVAEGAAAPAADAAASPKKGFLCGCCRRRLLEELALAVALLVLRDGRVPVLGADTVRCPGVVVQAGLAVQVQEGFGEPPTQGQAQLRQKACFSLFLFLLFSFSLFSFSCSFSLFLFLSFSLFLFLSFCLSVFLFFLLSFFLSPSFSLPVRCARGWGLTFTIARVLVSSTYRWARLATHRHQGTQHSVCSPCSRAHFGRVPHRMCVIAERLGCLHWLAHAARHTIPEEMSTGESRKLISKPFRKLKKITEKHVTAVINSTNNMSA